MHKRICLRSGIVVGAAATLLATGALVAQQGERPRPGAQPDHQMADPDHIMLTTKELKWKKGPPSLPAGAEMAVLEGDPASSGPFTMRLKLPADYQIPAHTHPAIEHVTVISGTFHMGKGDRLDTSRGKALPPGAFAVMAVGTQHYAWTGDEETIVQLHGMGPWGIDYLDPADDPRNGR